MPKISSVLHTLIMIAVLVFGFTGCAAFLQQQPSVEVPPLEISCDESPEMVDGDLETASALRLHTQSNSTTVIGNRARAVIKLNEPMYITHVEVYASDAMSDVRLFVAMAENQSALDNVLKTVRVAGTTAIHIQPGLVKKFRIGQKINYLRIDADLIKDASKASISGFGGGLLARTTPVKGPMVKEVKFYQIPMKESP